MTDLQVVVVVLTQQLQEAEDRLHDDHGRPHLRLHLTLLCDWLSRYAGSSGGDGLTRDQQRET